MYATRAFHGGNLAFAAFHEIPPFGSNIFVQDGRLF